MRSGPGQWLAALGFSAALYGLLQLLIAAWLGQGLRPDAVALDLAAHLGLAAVLFGLARGPGLFVASLTALLVLLHVGNALKLAILGGPVAPDDLYALSSLLLLLQGWPLAGAVTALAVAAGVLAVTIRPSVCRSWPALALVAGVGAALWLAPGAVTAALDRWLGNTPWDQPGNLQARGLLLHLLQESARYRARVGPAPAAAEVADAVLALDPPGRMPVALTEALAPTARNVHVIVLESFWDPTLLVAAGLSVDPVDPRLRDLWASAGHSRALSPVFGGYTANAEFEALCGFPVAEDAVFFEGRLRRDAPCLPRHLADAGYVTVASHPNVASFWNRVHAYRRAGFQVYWSRDDFDLDDMNREMLSDASLYRQVLARLLPLIEAGTPVLSYVLTFSGHLDYPLGPARPSVVDAVGAEPLVRAYANNVYYKSRELMDLLEAFAALDPEAVVVVFGDHLPFLGFGHGAYVESGLLAPERAAFTDAMFSTLVATPLLVIDGPRGPVPVGDVPIYRLPGMVLDLLADPRPSVLHLTETPPGLVLRPLPGMQLLLAGERALACRGAEDADPWCAEAAEWLDRVQLVAHDLFSGHQHALEAFPPSRDPGPDPL